MSTLIARAAQALAVIALCGVSPASFAQDVNSQVVVPDSGGSVAGCYRVQGPLYGPYRMTFCLGGKDSYRVTGAGLDCRAGLDWHRSRPGRIQIDLDYARCGQGAGWSADSLSCRVDGGRKRSGGHAEVVVPDRPGSADNLRCRYVPSERGYEPVSVTAKRLS